MRCDNREGSVRFDIGAREDRCRLEIIFETTCEVSLT